MQDIEVQAVGILNQFSGVEVNRPNKVLFILDSLQVTGKAVQRAIEDLKTQGWRVLTTTKREKGTRHRPKGKTRINPDKSML